ncbi:MAG: ATP cone domain-containing protein [Candidatus Uhrbacteria bacterium]|nr:ATP cone domain-containing protein [Candidatus Uhrbacteria bacterium]
MMIIKSDGSKVEYDGAKLRRSISRTGARKQLVEDVAADVEAQIKEGMTTGEIYRVVREELKKQSSCFACRYNLRAGILKLGPAGFKFEKYVASILKAYQYNAYVPEDDLEGSCVMHEVDVIAEKNGRRFFIEAKFRNRFQDNVDLKDTMATWSRFLDLVDGAAVGKCPHFDEVWIVTNAQFSDHALKFGVCKGIHMIGWNEPDERPLAGMVDNMTLYPITVLDGMKQSELEAFSEHDIMLCREVVDFDPEELAGKIGFSEERASDVIAQCAEVISEHHAENEPEHASRRT